MQPPKPDVAKPVEASPQASVESDKTNVGKSKNITFVENRNGKEIKHEGFFYNQYDTPEACEADTKQLIDSIPNKHLISGYKIIYNDSLKTYVGQLLGQDGKLIDDITKLFNQ